MAVRIIMVGGFLGAGKTTLLWESARTISETGKRVGLITNDQASELVDTAFLERANNTVLEVSGSCFCCNFNGLVDAITNAAKDNQSEIIIAEPVGSCTDLSATIMQPLKEKLGDDFIVAPLTVLADPDRLADILNGGTAGLHESAAYIFRKQLEEADLILVSKKDLLDPADLEALKKQAKKEWPLAQISSVSAKTGEGLDSWLGEVMTRSDSGTHLAEVDYDTYAEGEAVLGWLNATFKLRGQAVGWSSLMSSFIQDLGIRFETIGASVGHVKLLLKSGEDYVIGNLTGKSDTVRIRGNAGFGDEAVLTVNARVQMTPAELEAIIMEVLAATCEKAVSYEVLASNCLSPGRPNPTYRYDHTV